MKNLMKVFALVLSMGATAQVIHAYAYEQEAISAEEEQHKIIRLLELKEEARHSLLSDKFDSAEFPEIKTDADFNEAFSRHSLRYLQAIKGEEALRRVLNRPEFSRTDRGDPGV